MTQNSDPYENAVAERINRILKHEFSWISTSRRNNKIIISIMNLNRVILIMRRFQARYMNREK